MASVRVVRVHVACAVVYLVSGIRRVLYVGSLDSC